MYIIKEILSSVDNNDIVSLSSLLENSKLDETMSIDLLLYAIRNNNIDVFKLILNSKSLTINDSEANWLMKEALQGQKTDVFSLLLSNKNLDPSSCNQSVFTVALGMSNKIAVKLLLNDKRMDLTHNIEQIFSVVVHQNNEEIITLLMNNKIISKSLKEFDPELYNTYFKYTLKTKINDF
jgi:hypothetical protein